MTQATTIGVDGAERAVRPATSPRSGRRLRRRHLWLVPGLAIAVFANQLGNANGVGILALIAFGMAPDVPRLLGARGRPMHNLLHHPAPALAAVAVGALGAVQVVWLVGALIWLSHVVIGRGVGDVPRVPGARSDA